MKVLYVITGLAQGGAERVVCSLADSINSKGHQVKIVYLTGELITKPKSNDIEIISLHLNQAYNLPLAYISLTKIIYDFKPDIVHSHMFHANILTRLVRICAPNIRVISTAHNSNEGGTMRMLSYRLTNKLSHITTNVSKTAVEAFETKNAVPHGKMLTMYNGVDFETYKFYPSAKENILSELLLTKDTKLILAVGRFDSQKNYPNLLRAVKIIKNKNKLDFKLLIAGDGELRKEIEKLIINLDIESNVILLGRRVDIPKLMSSADAFVLSSDYEGLPTVLIEALACQCQIISTDVSGVKEILDGNGIIVPTNNSYKLAEAILETLNIKTKNLIGRENAKNKFELKMVADNWLKIYNDL